MAMIRCADTVLVLPISGAVLTAMRWIALILIAAAMAVHPESADAAGFTAYSASTLDTAIEVWLGRGKRRRAPAMSVAVGIDGELVFARGYGEARPGLPATPCTVYHIGSLSKQFTAAAMLRLIEGGAQAPRSGAVISLRSTPDEFFEHAEVWDASNGRAMTLRALLTMTSTLPNLLERPPASADPWGNVPAAQLLDALRTLPLSRRRGAFAYNNFNYFLLAEIIEAVAAADADGPLRFSEYVMAKVVTPAGLKSTGFIGDHDARRSMTEAIANWGDTPHYKRRPAYVAADWMKGAAEMTSSAVDLFYWNKALIDGHVLRPAFRDLMFSDAVRIGPFMSYGMGMFIKHVPGWDWYYHTGHVPGYTSLNAVVKSRYAGSWISVSLLTNADAVEGLDALSETIVDTLVQQQVASPWPTSPSAP